ncbi:MAG: NADH-quinone oxidoreductase subunit NuoE [bacterium]
MSAKTLVAEAVKKYGTQRESLLPILQYVHNKERYLSREAMQEIAAALDLSSADVYGTASFYSFLDVEERGKNIIKICKSISCDLKGKERIVTAIENKLKIKAGQTTQDKKFSIVEVNCLGWCHKAPAILINDKVYSDLTPEKAVAAIDEHI